MKAKLTAKQKEELRERIFSGLETQTEMSKDYDILPSTVSYYATKWGCSSKLVHKRPLTWNSSKIDKFLVNNNSTIKRVSQNIINVKHPLVWQCSLCMHSWKQTFENLRRNIEKSPYGCNACGRNEYSIYHNFLDDLTPLSTYFMGAYFSRGTYKLKSKGELNYIQISSDEKGKLERLSSVIFSTYPVIEERGGYKIRIKSKRFYEKLLEYNAIQKDHIPKIIPQSLKAHFIRGYVDFKGYFEKNIYPTEREHNKQQGCRFSISGKVEFMKELQEEYKEHVSHKYNLDNSKRLKKVKGYLQIRKKKNSNHSELHLNGVQNPFYFMEWIYNSEIVPLKYVSGSHYNTFLFLKQQKQQKDETRKYLNHKSQQYRKLKTKCNKLPTLTQMAKKYDVTFDQVKKISTKKSVAIPIEIKERIEKELLQKKRIQKIMNEIVTRVEHKTGMKKETFKRLK